jgi:hypothetical protein
MFVIYIFPCKEDFYLCVSQCYCILLFILIAVIQPQYFTSTQHHSPAIEVLQYRERAGYFATSLDVRNERPLHLRYRIGQVVKHRTLGYKGVIVGWDLQAKVLDC